MFNKNNRLLVLLVLMISIFNINCSPIDMHVEQDHKVDLKKAMTMQVATKIKQMM